MPPNLKDVLLYGYLKRSNSVNLRTIHFRIFEHRIMCTFLKYHYIRDFQQDPVSFSSSVSFKIQVADSPDIFSSLMIDMGNFSAIGLVWVFYSFRCQ